jgi:hypothetical protein
VIGDGYGNLLVADYAGSIWIIGAADPRTSAYQFDWDSDSDGPWSDRFQWDSESLAAEDRMAPHAWGTARYAASIDRAGADPTVTLDQNAVVESVMVGDVLHVTGGFALTVQQQLEILENGRLEGRGAVNGLVENYGAVTPGTLEASEENLRFGTLSMNGAYRQMVGGALQIDLGGEMPGVSYDQLVVDGAVQLAGSLNVSLMDSFEPELGDFFDILTTTASLVGQFDHLDLPPLSEGKAWGVHYDANIVSLIMTIPGDYNGDLKVDGTDFPVWQQVDGTSEGLAGWTSEFGATVASPANATVPEPETVALLLACMMTFIAPNSPLPGCLSGRVAA